METYDFSKTINLCKPRVPRFDSTIGRNKVADIKDCSDKAVTMVVELTTVVAPGDHFILGKFSEWKGVERKTYHYRCQVVDTILKSQDRVIALDANEVRNECFGSI